MTLGVQFSMVSDLGCLDRIHLYDPETKDYSKYKVILLVVMLVYWFRLGVFDCGKLLLVYTCKV